MAACPPGDEGHARKATQQPPGLAHATACPFCAPPIHAPRPCARLDAQLDTYLRALLASPAVALSPLVCTFLDGIDVQSFRAQMLPRLQQMEAADAAQQRPLTVPTQEEAPNGW